jgi:hypothetical protein
VCCFFAGLPFFFLLLKLELAVVHDAADGRIRLVADQDQVQIFFFGQAQGFARAHDPQLGAIGVDEANFGEADALVDGRQLCALLAGQAVKWTFYGQVFLSVNNNLDGSTQRIAASFAPLLADGLAPPSGLSARRARHAAPILAGIFCFLLGVRRPTGRKKDAGLGQQPR